MGLACPHGYQCAALRRDERWPPSGAQDDCLRPIESRRTGAAHQEDTPWEDRHLNALELAGNPGVPKTRSGMIRFAKRLCWPYQTRRSRGCKGFTREYPFGFLPETTQQAFRSRNIQAEVASPAPAPPPALTDAEIESGVYASAPEYARVKADKYVSLLRSTEGMGGEELRNFIENVWNPSNAKCRSSYQSVLRNRKLYREQGVAGILARFGVLAHRKENEPLIRNEWFERFKVGFLSQAQPSQKSCWLITLGAARQADPSIRIENFPSVSSFTRRLEREIGKEAIYLARHGKAAWNRKYAHYVDRDWDGLKANECWVGDHAQVDVAVRFPSGKVGFPWITAWHDPKTKKWLGWHHHPEAPNSDHIFYSFYKAAKRFGIPGHLYVDNGKDYRCRDFAGGRIEKIRVELDEKKTTSMLGQLGITPHFALPYRAQSKTIERDFLKNKEWFSKHMPGYRGGNVTERPEKLKDEVKAGRVIELNEYVSLMDDYIENISNEAKSDGKILQGMSPNEAWAKENPLIRKVGRDALKLFCMRTSKPITVGRNGARDSELAVTYWGEFMFPLKGEKVYLRRDLDEHNEAWVFNTNDQFLGMASLVGSVDALARTPKAKAELKAKQAQHRHYEKALKARLPDPEAAPSPRKIMGQLKEGVRAENELRGYVPREREENVMAMAHTKMDGAIAQRREMERAGTMDISAIVPTAKLKKTLYMFESDKRAAEGQS